MQRFLRLLRRQARFGRLAPIAGLVLLVAGILALNAPTLFRKPSFELAVKGTNGSPLRLAQSETPFETSEILDIKQGEASTILLTRAGDVYSLGDNMYGQLGNGNFGSPTDEFRKIPFPDGTTVRKVDMTHKHGLALSTGGDVWAWGNNVSGQIGDGSRDNTNKPVKVFSGASDIAAGYRFSAAITESGGELWAWGMQCDPATPGMAELAAAFAHDVSVGGSYYDGVAMNDNVYCLEQENLPIDSPKPRRIELAEPARFTSVAGGYGHLLMLDDKQTAWGFGCNGWGQLGRGNALNDGPARQVRRVAFPNEVKITEVDAGFRHSIARDSSGIAWAWGHDMHGEAISYKSNRADRPEKVSFKGSVLHVGAGHEVSGIIANNAFYAAGENQQAQISPPDADRERFALPEFQRIGPAGFKASTFSLGMLRQYYWETEK